MDAATSESPLRSDVDGDVDRLLRNYGCELIQKAGILLQLNAVTVATGQTILHQFYFKRSFREFDVREGAASSCFLAAKLEENPRKAKDVARVFDFLVNHETGPARRPIVHLDEIYHKEILRIERTILVEFGFRLDRLLVCPHRYVLQYVFALFRNLEEYSNHNVSDVAQLAWGFLNDSMRTTLCCKTQPWVIAAGCIYLAAKSLGIPLRKEDGWFLVFNARWSDIVMVCEEVERVYVSGKPYYVNVSGVKYAPCAERHPSNGSPEERLESRSEEAGGNCAGDVSAERVSDHGEGAGDGEAASRDPTSGGGTKDVYEQERHNDRRDDRRNLRDANSGSGGDSRRREYSGERERGYEHDPGRRRGDSASYDVKKIVHTACASSPALALLLLRATATQDDGVLGHLRVVHREPAVVEARVLLADLAQQLLEGDVDVLAVEARSFKKYQVVLTGKRTAVLLGDLAEVGEVALVSDQANGDVRVGVVVQLGEPLGDAGKARLAGDVVDDDGAHGPTVVGGGDGAVALLACGVPYLGFCDFSVVERHIFRGELDTDCALRVQLEVALDKSVEEVRLADVGIADQDDLEKVIIMLVGHHCVAIDLLHPLSCRALGLVELAALYALAEYGALCDSAALRARLWRLLETEKFTRGSQ
ncbi:cyclin 4, putative [Babesia caballi]|uniref:Cyclin 4, putative n=1 Tax=Babesia caballi TaxID=5871 RepID=A0AAV4M0R4_BABCB|nr:cyclin 4, putative [Babesia caballi]